MPMYYTVYFEGKLYAFLGFFHLGPEGPEGPDGPGLLGGPGGPEGPVGWWGPGRGGPSIGSLEKIKRV